MVEKHRIEREEMRLRVTQGKDELAQEEGRRGREATRGHQFLEGGVSSRSLMCQCLLSVVEIKGGGNSQLQRAVCLESRRGGEVIVR